ncbi:hypothetical protein [Chitinilyticum aquatile]|uniref:hypothetical protein n=1 Tax=Chitinilyticum aquatile TaxID=362520 RepID=UPI0003F6DCDD|nr:hypothetical protein [Chitinilyticum aquatile]
MNLRLHGRARTTPAVRAEIQAAPAAITDAELARRYGVSKPTIANDAGAARCTMNHTPRIICKPH